VVRAETGGPARVLVLAGRLSCRRLLCSSLHKQSRGR
jgi:hypothetical protein